MLARLRKGDGGAPRTACSVTKDGTYHISLGKVDRVSESSIRILLVLVAVMAGGYRGTNTRPDRGADAAV